MSDNSVYIIHENNYKYNKTYILIFSIKDNTLIKEIELNGIIICVKLTNNNTIIIVTNNYIDEIDLQGIYIRNIYTSLINNITNIDCNENLIVFVSNKYIYNILIDQVTLIDYTTGEIIFVFSINSKNISCVHFSKDNKHILVDNWNGYKTDTTIYDLTGTFIGNYNIF
jgi:hypothetical protein